MKTVIAVILVALVSPSVLAQDTAARDRLIRDLVDRHESETIEFRQWMHRWPGPSI